MKKVVCGCFGTIYYAQILKNGMMSSSNRIDITDEAIEAVLAHIMSMDGYIKNGFSGYDYKTITDGLVCLAAFDKSKYKIVRKEDESKNKEDQAVGD